MVSSARWRRAGWPRARDDELTVADLTGLGVQDAAIAALVDRLAAEHRAGRDVALAES